MKHITLTILFFIILVLPAHANMATEVGAVNKIYSQGDYEKAQIGYLELLNKDEENSIINFNLGNALYKNNQFTESVEKYRKALLTEDQKLQLQVRYNLGNALFYHGLSIEKQDIDQAIVSLEKTLTHYDQLRLSSNNDNVDYNYPLVEKELARLKQQQMQQQSQSSDQNQQNEQDQQQKQDQQDQQNNKDQKESSDQSEQNQNNSGNDEQNQNNNQKENDSQKQSEENQQQGDSSEGKQSDQKEQDQKEQDQNASQGDPKSSNEQQPVQQSKGGRVQAITKDEAKMLLEDYEQNKEPKGMLNFIQRKSSTKPTYQDW